MNTETLNEPVVTYPTVTDENGFYFESAEEKQDGISTKEYPNGKFVKRLFINRGKTEVILRELVAKDGKQTAVMAGFADGKTGDDQDLKFATIHLAATFNGDKLPMDEIANLRMKDFSKIMTANQLLNF